MAPTEAQIAKRNEVRVRNRAAKMGYRLQRCPFRSHPQRGTYRLADFKGQVVLAGTAGEYGFGLTLEQIEGWLVTGDVGEAQVYLRPQT